MSVKFKIYPITVMEAEAEELLKLAKDTKEEFKKIKKLSIIVREALKEGIEI